MEAIHQLQIDFLALLEAHELGDAELEPISEEAVENGEVFTRRWVVDLILDLVGYTPSKDLAALRAVEPACGTGAFVGPMVERLTESCRAHGRALLEAAPALRAFDLLPRNVSQTRAVAQAALRAAGLPPPDAEALAAEWVTADDYLLSAQRQQSVDFVIGNPPYIRLEDVPDRRMAAYRASCSTMTGRSDVYVGFFEVGLRSLQAPGGVLGFICADRWMRNQYGRLLRQMISDEYSVDVTISMHDVDAFEEQVSAYPAISIIRRHAQGQAVVADTNAAFGKDDAARIVSYVTRDDPDREVGTSYHVARLPRWFTGSASWPSGGPERLALIDDLNTRFRPVEDALTGTKVGIGVATGADGVFVTTDSDLVERDRLLPLSMVRDTPTGVFEWSGHYLVNPWSPTGGLVELAGFPRLSAYFEQHASQLIKRHVAEKRPRGWYGTIDRVNHSITDREKLLFPDMKATIHPVLDPGGYYPHHNLYYVVSDTWDMRVLGGLLLSRVAEVFIDAYGVKMRGGTLRFQAQYLRRIRVPDPESISPEDRAALAEAFDRRDVDAATRTALKLYEIDEETWKEASESDRV